MEEKRKSLEIKLDAEVSQGRFSNLAVITHTESNFVLDFIFVDPQAPRGTVFSRVITSPQHAKRFLKALQDNISKFESQFGALGTPAAAEPHSEGMRYLH